MTTRDAQEGVAAFVERRDADLPRLVGPAAAADPGPRVEACPTPIPTASPAPSSPAATTCTWSRTSRPPRSPARSPSRSRSTRRSTPVVLNAIELDDRRGRGGRGERPAAPPPSPSTRSTSGPPSPSPRALARRARRGRTSPSAGILNDKLHGFYRSTFTDDDGADPHHRHHPVRGHRRPPGLPVLGRARAQGRVRDHPRRPRATCSPSATRPRSSAEPIGDGRRRVALRRHHGDVHLPGGVHRRPARRPPTPSTSTASRCGSSTGPGRSDLTAFALESGAFALRYFAEYFGVPYPGRQARPGRHPRLRLRGHGEPGLRHVPRRPRCCIDPERGHPGRAPAGGRRRRTTRSPTCGSATWSP